MTEIDWDRVRREKNVHRANSVARPFEEKLELIERLRERDRALRAVRNAQKELERTTVREASSSLQNTRGQLSSGAIRLVPLGASASLIAVTVSKMRNGRTTNDTSRK